MPEKARASGCQPCHSLVVGATLHGLGVLATDSVPVRLPHGTVLCALSVWLSSSLPDVVYHSCCQQQLPYGMASKTTASRGHHDFSGVLWLPCTQVYVRVDEEGTEAAAVTAFLSRATAEPPKVVELVGGGMPLS